MQLTEILRRIDVVEYKTKELKRMGSCTCSSFCLQYEGSCQCKHGIKLAGLDAEHSNLLYSMKNNLQGSK